MPRKILITGASIAGNAAAWWLARTGNVVTVAERMHRCIARPSVCPSPCRHRASIPIPSALVDETAIASLSTRLRCDACDRRVATVSIDWGFTSARPIDPRS